MKRNLTIFVLILFTFFQVSLTTETQCHPQCAWKCDDPHCPAICDPICEPPKCHTSCAEPKNAICDVKCEKPVCEIKCPDKGCEMFDCPKCVTVCKQPHCVTHCQAPKPECEAVCEEPKCDWKCHKPNCPKPKCELVCENPNCTPKVECCPCNAGTPGTTPTFPFFKETERNNRCCGCNKNLPDGPEKYPKVTGLDPKLVDTRSSMNYVNTSDSLFKVDTRSKLELLPKVKYTGIGHYTSTAFPDSKEYQAAKDKFNLNIDYYHKKHRKHKH
jgi:hypothetical protein